MRKCVIPEGYVGSGGTNTEILVAAEMLEYFELPSTISTTIGPVTCIGSSTDSGCTMVMKSLVPPITTRIWSCKFNKILVPSSVVNDYKTATNWSSFANLIDAIPET